MITTLAQEQNLRAAMKALSELVELRAHNLRAARTDSPRATWTREQRAWRQAAAVVEAFYLAGGER